MKLKGGEGVPWKADPPLADGASQQEKIKTLLLKGQKQQQKARLKVCSSVKSTMMNLAIRAFQMKVKCSAFAFSLTHSHPRDVALSFVL